MYVASHAHAMHARVCTGGEGRVEAASTRSRKTFFAKNVVRLMFQPLTLRKGQDSTSTLSSRLVPTPYFKEGTGLDLYAFLQDAHNIKV